MKCVFVIFNGQISAPSMVAATTTSASVYIKHLYLFTKWPRAKCSCHFILAWSRLNSSDAFSCLPWGLLCAQCTTSKQLRMAATLSLAGTPTFHTTTSSQPFLVYIYIYLASPRSPSLSLARIPPALNYALVIPFENNSSKNALHRRRHAVHDDDAAQNQQQLGRGRILFNSPLRVRCGRCRCCALLSCVCVCADEKSPNSSEFHTN